MERELIVSRIQTPDGTILTSRHRHDYVSHIDKNGLTYFLDGGVDYQRVAYYPDAPYTDVSLYSDSPFDVIREHYCRGGRGKDGLQPLTWVPLSKMNDEWLVNCIEYNNRNGNQGCLPNDMYNNELKYRQENGITIIEE
jgi:hypothetical protein